jgi:hypothetical protein
MSSQAAPEAAHPAAPQAIPAWARIASNRLRERHPATAILPSSPRHKWGSP